MMSCCPVRAYSSLLIGPEYVFLGGGVLFVDRSRRTGSRAGAPICPTGLALWSDRAKVRVEVECDLMKRSRILLS
jgi:hypothetical protein